jgi:hypothetical protein
MSAKTEPRAIRQRMAPVGYNSAKVWSPLELGERTIGFVME